MVSAVTAGAVNVEVAVLAPESVTVGLPPVWLQVYESVSPSSSEPLPERVTDAPIATVCAAPASADGALLVTGVTEIDTVSLTLPVPSLTVSSKVSRVTVETVGATNDGVSVGACSSA